MNDVLTIYECKKVNKDLDEYSAAETLQRAICLPFTREKWAEIAAESDMEKPLDTPVHLRLTGEMRTLLYGISGNDEQTKNREKSIARIVRILRYGLFVWRTDEQNKGRERIQPFKLLGNKYHPKMREKIEEILGNHEFHLLVDPCAGSLGCILPYEDKFKRIVINDLNLPRVICYLALQKFPLKLALSYHNFDVENSYPLTESRIEKLVITEAKKHLKRDKKSIIDFIKYSVSVEELEQILTEDDIVWLAIQYIFMTQTKGSSGKKEISLDEWIEGMPDFFEISKRLKKASIYHDDFMQILKKNYRKNDCLMMVDPPYLLTKTYKNNLQEKDYKKLSRLLKSSRRNADFLLFFQYTITTRKAISNNYTPSDVARENKKLQRKLNNLFKGKGYFQTADFKLFSAEEKILTTLDGFPDCTKF